MTRLVLGFDTSAAHCAAALARGGDVLTAIAEEMARGQAERLMGLLEQVLSDHGATWQDLSAIGVGVGPGNFTGIRIGVSAARGLALGLGVPAYGVNGFEQRAHLGAAYPSVPAPRDHLYVLDAGTPVLAPRSDMETRVGSFDPQPTAVDLARSIAEIAARRFPTPATAPAPLYVRPADAAPPREAPPRILDDA